MAADDSTLDAPSSLSRSSSLSSARYKLLRSLRATEFGDLCLGFDTESQTRVIVKRARKKPGKVAVVQQQAHAHRKDGDGDDAVDPTHPTTDDAESPGHERHASDPSASASSSSNVSSSCIPREAASSSSSSSSGASSGASSRVAGSIRSPRREARIMYELSRFNDGHLNVLRIVDAYEAPISFNAVLEYCEGGDVLQLVMQRGKLCEVDAGAVLRQAVDGLAHVHACGYAHLDLSAENILITDGGIVKLSDFGTALPCPADGLFDAPQSSHEAPGNVNYQAPEVFALQPYNGYSADVYSLGVVLFVMLTGTQPYVLPTRADKYFSLIYSGNLSRRLSSMLRSDGSPACDLSPQVIDLMQGMLSPPDSRLSLADVQSHEWLTATTNVDLSETTIIATPVIHEAASAPPQEG